MGANTKIQWCDHTVNFWWGCEKVSPACTNCYAETLAKRFHPKDVVWSKEGKRLIRKDAAVRELRTLDKSARKRGVRERVFIESMGDLFEDRPDLTASRNMLFVIAEKLTNLDLLLLTKRPQNVVPMLEVIRKYWMADKLPLFPHIWIGATVENQEMADRRIPELLKIPAKVRFLSCEPLLGPVRLRMGNVMAGFPKHISEDGCASGAPLNIHWVICGGESGPKARPMNPDWARSLRDQCKAAGAPFLFKQHGNWLHESQIDNDTSSRSKHLGKAHRWEDGTLSVWVKDKGLRLLDGNEHNEFPEV